jgi:CheY-like chemotaxis protein
VIVAQSRDSKLLAKPVASGTRVLLLVALVATAYYTLTPKPMGIAVPTPVYIVDAIAFAILLAASVAAIQRRVPVGWGDVVGALCWWCPSVAILATLLERTLPRSIAIHDRLDVAGVRVEGDPVHLTQALINFGLNAADAMNGNGTLVLAAAVLDLATDNPHALPAGPYVRISVTDTGIGMTAATCLRVFEPFFTTKPLGRGTGLGLSTVWGIAQGHKGAVAVESEPGRGTTFSLYLPTTDAPLAPTVERAASQPVVRAGTMLVVDDEPAVRDGTRRILGKLGFDVVVAGDGAEALRIFDQHDGAFDLVVLDMGMPVMGGPECFAALRRKSQVPILLATGYAVDAEARALVAAGARIIEKPFRSEELVREVTRMLHT